jgi:hypothetical protein
MTKLEINYKSIVQHYENCFNKYGDSHLGVDWPNKEDAIKRHQIMLEMVSKSNKSISLLDFGCGLSHFNDFIRAQKRNDIIYNGLDLSKKMVDASKNKLPELTFYQGDILKKDFLPIFDYIVMNGVFTEKLELDHIEMLNYLKQLLKVLFKKVKIGLAFNVMSKNVDWERDDLFHLGYDELTAFISNELSRNFIIRNDYGLYEYTTYIYK